MLITLVLLLNKLLCRRAQDTSITVVSVFFNISCKITEEFLAGWSSSNQELLVSFVSYVEIVSQKLLRKSYLVNHNWIKNTLPTGSENISLEERRQKGSAFCFGGLLRAFLRYPDSLFSYCVRKRIEYRMHIGCEIWSLSLLEFF